MTPTQPRMPETGFTARVRALKTPTMRRLPAAGHPVVTGQFQNIIAVNAFFEVPVMTADITAVRQIGHFEECRQRSLLQLEPAAHTEIQAGKSAVLQRVARAGHRNQNRLTICIRSIFCQREVRRRPAAV